VRASSARTQREAAWEVVLQTLGGPPAHASELEGEPRGGRFPASAGRSLSVTVLTGFLGAGKTTLLCRLLEQTSLRITAIVNDVASINVDAALIRSRSEETIEFQNGCACCALQTDLRETLEEVVSWEMLPEAVVIEASGIADPMGIAQTVANVPGATLDGIVTLVDALSFHSRSSDPGTASLFVRQIAAAHLVVLTKTSELSDLRTLTHEMEMLAPGRPVLACDDLFRDGGETASQILLGAAVRGARPALGASHRLHSAFAVETRSWTTPLPEVEFFDLLDGVPDSLYRMKGSVWLSSQPEQDARCVDVQVVGPRWRVTDGDFELAASHLVLIGQAEAASFSEYAARLAELPDTRRTHSI